MVKIFGIKMSFINSTNILNIPNTVSYGHVKFEEKFDREKLLKSKRQCLYM